VQAQIESTQAFFRMAALIKSLPIANSYDSSPHVMVGAMPDVGAQRPLLQERVSAGSLCRCGNTRYADISDRARSAR